MLYFQADFFYFWLYLYLIQCKTCRGGSQHLAIFFHQGFVPGMRVIFVNNKKICDIGRNIRAEAFVAASAAGATAAASKCNSHQIHHNEKF